MSLFARPARLFPARVMSIFARPVSLQTGRCHYLHAPSHFLQDGVIICTPRLFRRRAVSLFARPISFYAGRCHYLHALSYFMQDGVIICTPRLFDTLDRRCVCARTAYTIAVILGPRGAACCTHRQSGRAADTATNTSYLPCFATRPQPGLLNRWVSESKGRL